MTEHDYDEFPRDAEPEPGDAPPSPDDLLSIPQIAQMYGVNPAAVRQWRMAPAKVVPFGSNGVFKLFRRADVEAYANSERRQNRLKAQKR